MTNYQIAIAPVGYARASLAARWFGSHPPAGENPD